MTPNNRCHGASVLVGLLAVDSLLQRAERRRLKWQRRQGVVSAAGGGAAGAARAGGVAVYEVS